MAAAAVPQLRASVRHTPPRTAPTHCPRATRACAAGEVISRTSVLNKAAGYSADAAGLRIAYRKSAPAASKASADKLPVLLLHGLGSSSWSFRCVCVCVCLSAWGVVCGAGCVPRHRRATRARTGPAPHPLAV